MNNQGNNRILFSLALDIIEAQQPLSTMALQLQQTTEQQIEQLKNTLGAVGDDILGPVLAQMKTVLERQTKELPALQRRMAELLLESYTPEELKELHRWSRTAIGAEIARKSSAITIKGSELGAAWALEIMKDMKAFGMGEDILPPDVIDLPN